MERTGQIHQNQAPMMKILSQDSDTDETVFLSLGFITVRIS